MEKKTVKIIATIVTIIMLMMVLSTGVMAADELISSMNPDYSDTGSVGTIGGKIVNILSIIGVVVAVIVLLVLGIKYMMGSASEKAEYKKTMIPYLVGAILIFAASVIANVVYQFAKGI